MERTRRLGLEGKRRQTTTDGDVACVEFIHAVRESCTRVQERYRVLGGP